MAIATDAFEALGGFQCLANTPTTTDSIKDFLVNGVAIFSTATITKIKTENAMLSIDGTVKFMTTYDAISNLQRGHTYIFDKDTTLMVGKYVTV